MAAEVSGRDYQAGTRLERLLRGGHFAVTAELCQPQGGDAGVIRRKAALLRGACDAINVSDNPMAIVRMSSIAAGVILVQEGLEPVIQVASRDRNRLAIQSDLLGANALGMHNLLCLTGDHQTCGNHPSAKDVFDIDSMQMVQMAAAMRDEGILQCGDPLEGEAPRFLIGATASPFADPVEFRPYRLAKKVKAGASFIQTQPIYDVEGFELFMGKVRSLGLHEKSYILAGVGPLRSPAAALHIRENEPWLPIPDGLIDRLVRAGDPWAEKSNGGLTQEEEEARSAAWREEGIKISIELIEQIREIEGVAGVHIMAGEWEEAVKPIVEGAGLLPRPDLDGATPPGVAR